MLTDTLPLTRVSVDIVTVAPARPLTFRFCTTLVPVRSADAVPDVVRSMLVVDWVSAVVLGALAAKLRANVSALVEAVDCIPFALTLTAKTLPPLIATLLVPPPVELTVPLPAPVLPKPTVPVTVTRLALLAPRDEVLADVPLNVSVPVPVLSRTLTRVDSDAAVDEIPWPASDVRLPKSVPLTVAELMPLAVWVTEPFAAGVKLRVPFSPE